MEKQDIKKVVRESYAKVAKSQSSCCAPASSCCGDATAQTISKNIGYTEEQLSRVPDTADMGLGCGNPVNSADIKSGETVLDLGSGGGIDCFLAAKKVGETGKVIGVDMTAEMIDRARKHAEVGNFDNVEFRLGEIEHLPAADRSVDVILSNCVINLAADKSSVYREAHRILKPGGRFVVSDIVVNEPLPDWILESVQAYSGCISGALMKDEYLKIISEAGFKDVEILGTRTFPIELMENDPTAQALIQHTGASMEQLNQVLKSVESITVIGKKESGDRRQEIGDRRQETGDRM